MYTPNRREVLTGGALLGAGLAADALLSACGDNAPLPPVTTEAPETPAAVITPDPVIVPGKRTTTEAYLPTWLDSSDYDAMGKRLDIAGGAISRMHLSFAEPTTSGIVGRPNLSEGLGKLIKSAADGTSLSVAVGGASATKEAWGAAMANPEKFAGSVEALRKAFEQLFGREVHVDFDFEVEGTEAAALTKLVTATRKAMAKDRQLSMAVTAGYMLETFDAPKLTKVVDTFHVMTYDLNGPGWSETAGPIATGDFVVGAIDDWVQRAGDPSKVQVGFPAYGYRFNGAKEPGDSFKKPTGGDDGTVNFTDMPGKILDDLTTLTSETHDNRGNYVSCLSPAVIGKIAAKLYEANPTLGGAFYWEMNGMTADHLSAVQSAK